ncbi:Cys-tRNA(Pro) deacylase [Salinifilum ghardaiensis]
MAGKGTPATKLLSQRGTTHRLHEYEHDPRAESFGREAAERLGVAPERLLKTLIADVDGTLTAAVVPTAEQLDLKALAAAAGGKKGRMADAEAAERATGYVAGGISPLGQRKRLPAVVHAGALEHATVLCSGGRRGLQIELAPQDLVALLDARVADITGAG